MVAATRSGSDFTFWLVVVPAMVLVIVDQVRKRRRR